MILSVHHLNAIYHAFICHKNCKKIVKLVADTPSYPLRWVKGEGRGKQRKQVWKALKSASIVSVARRLLAVPLYLCALYRSRRDGVVLTLPSWTAIRPACSGIAICPAWKHPAVSAAECTCRPPACLPLRLLTVARFAFTRLLSFVLTCMPKGTPRVHRIYLIDVPGGGNVR